jgi:hypothetical protein
MTIEEITLTLSRVASNQAKHDEMHERHKADIAEIDKMIAASLESQSRYDRQLSRIFEAMDKNEERFASLADGMRRLEGSYELLESFVKSIREETHDYFAETDVKLAALASIQATTNDVLASFVKETNGRFAETDKKLAALAESQARTDEQMRRTDEQIKALVLSQTRTDEMVRSLVERNGKSSSRAKKSAKKTGKKGSAK